MVLRFGILHLMDLHDGEPDCGPWRATDPASLLAVLRSGPVAMGAVAMGAVAIDGRGGSGKSTVAAALFDAARDEGLTAALVHTDDIAWYQSFFGWDGLLAEHVLAPARRGEPVRYRPDAWRERGREGEIRVDAGVDLLLVEGSGSARRSLAPWFDRSVWVQVDRTVAQRRLLDRDGADEAPFIAEWNAQEEPFMLAERPWDRDLVIRCDDDGSWWRGAR